MEPECGNMNMNEFLGYNSVLVDPDYSSMVIDLSRDLEGIFQRKFQGNQEKSSDCELQDTNDIFINVVILE